ncbi:sigma-70 family RNA polymerase sigma factor [Teredinibacter turnerae]|uniref:sigma-70 family RNA polymerase sigma factor n=1 Tax=Teredinibacter turnerae TaxID=2426 RepID=UPI00036CDE6A|nr:sigma-70 family RNA polymerase sigma factor [Teredinibacter turnerae]
MATVENRKPEQIQHLNDIKSVADTRDRKAFERLFDHFVPLLRAFSLSAQPGAYILADEVAQEVMIKVWKKAHTYNPDVASVSTWIFTLARNARIDYLRKNSRHQSDIDPENVWGDLVDEGNDPFLAAQQKRNETMIRDSLAELPEEQKTALMKVYMEGKTHKEVATDLGLPLGTVKSRIRLALHKMAISVTR